MNLKTHCRSLFPSLEFLWYVSFLQDLMVWNLVGYYQFYFTHFFNVFCSLEYKYLSKRVIILPLLVQMQVAQLWSFRMMMTSKIWSPIGMALNFSCSLLPFFHKNKANIFQWCFSHSSLCLQLLSWLCVIIAGTWALTMFHLPYLRLTFH